MEIKILKIDKSSAVPAPGTSGRGYSATFECLLAKGQAVIVPAPGYEANLAVGRVIDVETTQERVANLRALATPIPECMTPLRAPGNYRVVGTVQVLYADGVAAIGVMGLSFLVSVPPQDLPTVMQGQKVQFDLFGLSLWDTNL